MISDRIYILGYPVHKAGVLSILTNNPLGTVPVYCENFINVLGTAEIYRIKDGRLKNFYLADIMLYMDIPHDPITVEHEFTPVSNLGNPSNKINCLSLVKSTSNRKLIGLSNIDIRNFIEDPEQGHH